MKKNIDNVVEDMMHSESHRQMLVVTPGYQYQLHNLGEGVQNIQFIEKDAKMKTINEGTTNEAVLQSLIHRITFLNAKMTSPHNVACLAYLDLALRSLYKRTAERKIAGVEGTSQPLGGAVKADVKSDREYNCRDRGCGQCPRCKAAVKAKPKAKKKTK